MYTSWRPAVVLVLVAVSSVVVQAADYTWDNGAFNNLWAYVSPSGKTNWGTTDGTYPHTADDTAIIPPAYSLVDLGGVTQTCGRFSYQWGDNTTFLVTNGVLATNRLSVQNDHMTCDADIIDAGGNGLDIYLSRDAVINGLLTVTGDLTRGDSHGYYRLYLKSGGNSVGGDLEMTGGLALEGSLRVDGDMLLTGKYTTYAFIQAPLSVGGLLRQGSGNIWVDANVEAGTGVELHGGEFLIGSRVTISGPILVTYYGDLTVNAPTMFRDTLRLEEGGSASFTAQAYLQGDVEVAGGSLTFDHAVRILGDVYISGGLLRAQGTGRLGGADSANLYMTGGSAYINGDATDGTVDVRGGTVRIYEGFGTLISVTSAAEGVIDLEYVPAPTDVYHVGDFGAIRGTDAQLGGLQVGPGGNLTLEPGAAILHESGSTGALPGGLNPADGPRYITDYIGSDVTVGSGSDTLWQGVGDDGGTIGSSSITVGLAGDVDLVALHQDKTTRLEAKLQTLGDPGRVTKRGAGRFVLAHDDFAAPGSAFTSPAITIEAGVLELEMGGTVATTFTGAGVLALRGRGESLRLTGDNSHGGTEIRGRSSADLPTSTDSARFDDASFFVVMAHPRAFGPTPHVTFTGKNCGLVLEGVDFPADGIVVASSRYDQNLLGAASGDRTFSGHLEFGSASALFAKEGATLTLAPGAVLSRTDPNPTYIYHIGPGKIVYDAGFDVDAYEGQTSPYTGYLLGLNAIYRQTEGTLEIRTTGRWRGDVYQMTKPDTDARSHRPATLRIDATRSDGGTLVFKKNDAGPDSQVLEVTGGHVWTITGLMRVEAPLTVGGDGLVDIGPDGRLVVLATGHFGGPVRLAGGVCAQTGTNSNTPGDFVRSLGTGPDQVAWVASEDSVVRGGGFAAIGSPMTVNIGGSAEPTALAWGATPHFVADGVPLLLGATDADHIVTFVNPLDLGPAGIEREVRVTGTNPTAGAQFAELRGEASLRKTGDGLLIFDRPHPYGGTIVLERGTLCGTGEGAFRSGTAPRDVVLAAAAAGDSTLELRAATDTVFGGAVTLDGEASQRIILGPPAGGTGPGVVMTIDRLTVEAGQTVTILGYGTSEAPGYDLRVADALTNHGCIRLGGGKRTGLLINGYSDSPGASLYWIRADNAFPCGFIFEQSADVHARIEYFGRTEMEARGTGTVVTYHGEQTPKRYPYWMVRDGGAWRFSPTAILDMRTVDEQGAYDDSIPMMLHWSGTGGTFEMDEGFHAVHPDHPEKAMGDLHLRWAPSPNGRTLITNHTQNLPPAGLSFTGMPTWSVRTNDQVLDAPLTVDSGVPTLDGLGPVVETVTNLTLQGLLEIRADKKLTKAGPGTLFINGPQGHGAGSMLQVGGSMMDEDEAGNPLPLLYEGGTVMINYNAGAPALSSCAAAANLAVYVGDGLVRFTTDQDLADLTVAPGIAGPAVDLASWPNHDDLRVLRLYPNDLAATLAEVEAWIDAGILFDSGTEGLGTAGIFAEQAIDPYGSAHIHLWSVPEPGTLGLLAVAVLVALARRRRPSR